MAVVYKFDKLLHKRHGNYLFQFLKNRKLTDIYHAHDFFELIYYLRGNCTQLVNDEVINNNESDLVLLRPGDQHCFLTQSENIELISLSVQKEEFELFANTYDPLLFKQVCAEKSAVCFHAESDIAHNIFAPHTQNVTQYDCKFFLSFFLRIYLTHTHCLRRVPDLPLNLAYAAEEMKKQDNLKMGIPAFVTLSNYSQSHLARLVKMHFGSSLKQYINELRLQHAYNNIILTSESIEKISESLGFASFSHFNKIFKKRFSITPATLRKRNGIWTA